MSPEAAFLAAEEFATPAGRFYPEGFINPDTFSLTGLPRPADDKYAGRMPWSDPLYSVWGEKV